MKRVLLLVLVFAAIVLAYFSLKYMTQNSQSLKGLERIEPPKNEEASQSSQEIVKEQPILVEPIEPVPQEKKNLIEAPNEEMEPKRQSNKKPKQEISAANKPTESSPKKNEPSQPKTQIEKALLGMQSQYDKVKGFSADFVQVYHAKISKMKSEGKVKFRKPGLMRFDYAKPNEKLFIVDGNSLYDYRPNDKQVMVNNCFKQDTLTTSLAFLWGGGNISKEFDAKKFDGLFGDETDLHIQMTPKEKSKYFKRLIFVIDPNKYQVKQSIVVDLEGNINQFTFSNVQYDAKVSDADFVFKKPTDVHEMKIGNCEGK